jgi:hypothetical protein
MKINTKMGGVNVKLLDNPSNVSKVYTVHIGLATAASIAPGV